MIYAIIAVVYFLGAYVTAAAGFADMQAFDMTLTSDAPRFYRHQDFLTALVYALIPFLWISILIATKGYKAGFDWTFKGK